MTVAILADIHGNIRALEAVLQDLSTVQADRVIINGDLVNRGPHSVRVIEMLWGGAYTFTLGNHDDLMWLWANRDSSLPPAWFGDPFWRATARIAEELADAGWLEVLRSFHMSCEVKIHGAPALLISHGSPRHYREGYGDFTPAHILAEIAAAYTADIFIGSHTHRPFDQMRAGRRFLNTGAVGTPFNRDPRAQYLLMHFDTDGWRPEFRCVPYDRQAALADFEQTGFLRAGDLSAQIFKDELRLARPLFDPFWRWTHENDLPQDWAAWDKFQQTFRERFAVLPG